MSRLKFILIMKFQFEDIATINRHVTEAEKAGSFKQQTKVDYVDILE